MVFEFLNIRISSSKVYLAFILIHLCHSLAYSQNTLSSKPLDTLPLYEQVHLHLNKTSFVKGEQIWFAAYVQNKASSMASQETQLLRIALHDRDGKRIKTAAVRIQNGFGNGTIKVDSLLTDAQYYLMAYTNYMRNFKELKPYLQKIDLPYNQHSIAEPRIEPIGVQFINKEQLVSGIANNIAFKITGIARGYIKDRGISILNGKGEPQRTKISLNNDNIGKFQLIPEPGESYQLKYELTNGGSELWPLPKTVDKGIDLSINSLHEEDLYISLNSTPILEDTKSFRDLSLTYLQNNGQLIIVTPKEMSTKIKIAKSSLPYGLNIVNVQLDDKILMSRSFFNDFDMDKRIRTIELQYKLNASKDSVYVSIQSADQIDDQLQISLSALPYETKAYKPFSSLNQSFWINNFVDKGTNESTDYTNLNSRKTKVNLDLSLLETAKRSYKDLLVSKPETIAYTYEQGFPIKGQVEDANLKVETQIYGIGRSSNIPFFEDLKYDGSFEHQGLIYQGDSLRLSLVDNLGKLRKPVVKLQPIKYDGTAYQDFLLESIDRINFQDVERYAESSPLILEPDVTVLDEVVLDVSNWMQSNIALNTAEVVGTRILDDDIKKNATFGAYMRRQGYRLALASTPGKFQIMSKIPVPGKKGARLPIAIIINGFAEPNKDFYDFPLSRVIAIFNDSFGYLFVNVILRPGFYDPNQEDNYKPIYLSDGLLPPSPYKDPNYLNTSTNAFKWYAALHWDPDILLENNKAVTVAIPLHQQKKIELKIEGMDSSGRLLSLSQIIKPFGATSE